MLALDDEVCTCHREKCVIIKCHANGPYDVKYGYGIVDVADRAKHLRKVPLLVALAACKCTERRWEMQVANPSVDEGCLLASHV